MIIIINPHSLDTFIVTRTWSNVSDHCRASKHRRWRAGRGGWRPPRAEIQSRLRRRGDSDLVYTRTFRPNTSSFEVFLQRFWLGLTLVSCCEGTSEHGASGLHLVTAVEPRRRRRCVFEKRFRRYQMRCSVLFQKKKRDSFFVRILFCVPIFIFLKTCVIRFRVIFL